MAASQELRTKGVPIVTVIPPKGVYATTSYFNISQALNYREATLAFAEPLLSDQGMPRTT